MPNIQAAGTSSAGGGSRSLHADANAAKPCTGSAVERPQNTEAGTTRISQLIALKEGDPIPEGYALVVQTHVVPVAPGSTEQQGPCDTVDLTTPPRANVPCGQEGLDSAKARTAATRNLTRNTNRKANVTFARELKDSLATGRPTTMKVAEDQKDLKSIWHAGAKEVAYKFLDLTKESWKEYTIFEKNMVHNELKEQFKFQPPIDPKCIDKYLSGHLRTSRAVWKAHWKKFGPSKRHHNCPQDAWDKLCKWWPTTACQEEAAEMASRRARVENTSKVGRTSLLDRMDKQVSNDPHMSDFVYILQACVVRTVCVCWMQRVAADRGGRVDSCGMGKNCCDYRVCNIDERNMCSKYCARNVFNPSPSVLRCMPCMVTVLACASLCLVHTLVVLFVGVHASVLC